MKNEIWRSFAADLDFPCDEEKILRTVAAAKETFCETEAEKSLTKLEFLYRQSKFIKKRWWVLQGALLAALCCLLQIADSDWYVQRCLGIAAPLFGILLLPELWKNRNSAAMEVECTTFYTLRQIYAARFTLFAGVDLMLLSLFFAAASLTARIPLWEMLVQFLLPLNVTCCICFRTLYAPKHGTEVFSLLLCSIWVGIWVQIVLNEAVYAAISVPTWCALLAASILYLGYSIYHGQKNWLQTWEVKPIWN